MYLKNIKCTVRHSYRLATWERKIRYERLKDMLKGVTQMDVLLLEEHLDTYLSLVQGKYWAVLSTP